jgi:hypothetical protein
MAMKAIRMRVRDGHLEPLEELALVEGSEITAMVPVPDPEGQTKPKLVIPNWNLGFGAREVTREDAYDDGI